MTEAEPLSGAVAEVVCRCRAGDRASVRVRGTQQCGSLKLRPQRPHKHTDPAFGDSRSHGL